MVFWVDFKKAMKKIRIFDPLFDQLKKDHGINLCVQLLFHKKPGEKSCDRKTPLKYAMFLGYPNTIFRF